MTGDGYPVTLNSFLESMDSFRAVTEKNMLAVAVSGGADSIALCRLAHEWGSGRDIDVVGLTVDHKLRDSSKAEALQVSAWLNAFGMKHYTLSWADGIEYSKKAQSMQSVAREARYNLLCEWCNNNNVSVILMGHHADDQVETFLYRLIRGSGIDGLSAMEPAIVRSGVNILRPLLNFSKSELVATCDRFSQPFIEDPSNIDHKYARVRIRKLIAEFDKEGLSLDRLINTIGHIKRAKSAITHFVDEIIEDHVIYHENGSLSIPLQVFLHSPTEVALRLLARCLMIVGKKGYTTRFKSLMNLYQELCREGRSARTLHGCKISCKNKEVLICVENINV
ncbi:MAG: tRNA lysidine(34) synthetase TilS [Rhodospirillaceae bacterium]|nr:tRNA lysidine(34) synthetase TilS [Rhodospirillaceae bacterium]